MTFINGKVAQEETQKRNSKKKSKNPKKKHEKKSKEKLKNPKKKTQEEIQRRSPRKNPAKIEETQMKNETGKFYVEIMLCQEKMLFEEMSTQEFVFSENCCR
ncbi:hypothetical protein RhiirC2_716400 [Rhizophagus irregularis]|uniref:Uncharacterized protein n=1 Tax=Rhizophagus irregularis TaxID=588596 RepID=A0A2N1MRJ7_9GLOM|nr:hypothetical protein RhiirC2_716400 [Rhizophagus irregularis]